MVWSLLYDLTATIGLTGEPNTQNEKTKIDHVMTSCDDIR